MRLLRKPGGITASTSPSARPPRFSASHVVELPGCESAAASNPFAASPITPDPTGSTKKRKSTPSSRIPFFSVAASASAAPKPPKPEPPATQNGSKNPNTSPTTPPTSTTSPPPQLPPRIRGENPIWQVILNQCQPQVARRQRD